VNLPNIRGASLYAGTRHGNFVLYNKATTPLHEGGNGQQNGSWHVTRVYPPISEGSVVGTAQCPDISSGATNPLHGGGIVLQSGSWHVTRVYPPISEGSVVGYSTMPRHIIWGDQPLTWGWHCTAKWILACHQGLPPQYLRGV